MLLSYLSAIRFTTFTCNPTSWGGKKRERESKGRRWGHTAHTSLLPLALETLTLISLTNEITSKIRPLVSYIYPNPQQNPTTLILWNRDTIPHESLSSLLDYNLSLGLGGLRAFSRLLPHRSFIYGHISIDESATFSSQLCRRWLKRYSMT